MSGSVICYWAIRAISGSIFCVTVQWELFQAVPVIMRCLAVFITVQYERFRQGHLLLCTRSYVWQRHLVMCNTISGGVIYSCARVYFGWNLSQDGSLGIKACCGLLSTLSVYFVE